MPSAHWPGHESVCQHIPVLRQQDYPTLSVSEVVQFVRSGSIHHAILIFHKTRIVSSSRGMTYFDAHQVRSLLTCRCYPSHSPPQRISEMLGPGMRPYMAAHELILRSSLGYSPRLQIPHLLLLGCCVGETKESLR